MYKEPKVESSFSKNKLGKTLYEFVREKQPWTIIEFGVLNGYSAIAMGQALKDNGQGKLIAYDLWDKYPYKHGSKEEVQKALEEYGVADYVELREGNFYEWEEEPYDMLFVDISNCGDVIRQLNRYSGWRLFEGGTWERDGVQWMDDYDRLPINKSGVKYKILNEDFPSISMICD